MKLVKKIIKQKQSNFKTHPQLLDFSLGDCTGDMHNFNMYQTGLLPKRGEGVQGRLLSQGHDTVLHFTNHNTKKLHFHDS